MPGLFVNKLTYEYSLTPVIQSLGLALDFGAGLHVTGANGSGKSTLLRLLAGLLTPTSGEVTWAGNPSIAFLGHKNGLKNDLTVLENIHYAVQFQNQTFKQQPELVLSLMGILSLKNQLVRYLSFGQKRKVALAKIFLAQTQVWILDEPLIGLDSATLQTVSQQLQSHLDSSGMLILTHHGEPPLPELNSCYLEALC